MKRNLCYRHHTAEFDKLSNAMRHLAADWRTVEPKECELCKEQTMEHTPGPLSIKRADDGEEPDWAIVDAEGRIIGEAFCLVYFDTHRPAEANAWLWAKAPDLLAALEALLANRGGHSVTDDTQDNAPVMLAVTAGEVKQARAAVAGAQGGG
jgi:hypothetical protein